MGILLFLTQTKKPTLSGDGVILPQLDEEDEEGGDPRAELVRKLLEYQAFKEAAKELGLLEGERAKMFTRQKLKMSCSKTVKSAHLPGANEPSCSSRRAFQAATAVKPSKDSSRDSFWSGNHPPIGWPLESWRVTAA